MIKSWKNGLVENSSADKNYRVKLAKRRKLEGSASQEIVLKREVERLFIVVRIYLPNASHHFEPVHFVFYTRCYDYYHWPIDGCKWYTHFIITT